MKGTKISDEPITYTYAPNGLTYNGDYAGEVYTEHDINKRGSYSDASGANNTWVVADGTTNVSVSDTTPRNYEGPSSDVYVVNNLDNSVVQVTDYYEGEVELLPANTVYRYDSDWNYVPVEGAYACSNYVMSNGVYKEGWRLDHGVVYDGEEVIENAYNLSFEERIEDEEGVHYINHLKLYDSNNVEITDGETYYTYSHIVNPDQVNSVNDTLYVKEASEGISIFFNVLSRDYEEYEHDTGSLKYETASDLEITSAVDNTKGIIIKYYAGYTDVSTKTFGEGKGYIEKIRVGDKIVNIDIAALKTSVQDYIDTLGIGNYNNAKEVIDYGSQTEKEGLLARYTYTLNDLGLTDQYSASELTFTKSGDDLVISHGENSETKEGFFADSKNTTVTTFNSESGIYEINEVADLNMTYDFAVGCGDQTITLGEERDVVLNFISDTREKYVSIYAVSEDVENGAITLTRTTGKPNMSGSLSDKTIDNLTITDYLTNGKGKVTFDGVIFKDEEATISLIEDAISTDTSKNVGLYFAPPTITPGEEYQGSWLNERLVGTSSADIIYGNGGDDVIDGGKGNDTLYGGDGDDTITGGKGDDTIKTGAGNNTVFFNTSDFGNDIIDTTDSTTDTFNFTGSYSLDAIKNADYSADADGNLVVTLDENNSFTIANYIKPDGNVDEEIANKITIQSGTEAETLAQIDPVIEIEGKYVRDKKGRIYGTDNNDLMNGDKIKDGKTLNSTFYGKDGKDTIISGKGNDTIYGGAKADTFVFSIGDGKDTVMNEGKANGGDTLRFYGINEDTYFLIKESGKDLIVYYGNEGDQVTIKGALTDNHSVKYIEVYNENGTKTQDIVIPGSSSESTAPIFTLDVEDYGKNNVKGSAYAEYIVGNTKNNTLRGGGGNDVIYANQGNNTIYADSRDGDNVTVYSGSGNDKLIAGKGNDTLVQNDMHGDDTINFNKDGIVTIDLTGLTGTISFSESGKNLIINDTYTMHGGLPSVEHTTVANYLKNADLASNVLIKYSTTTDAIALKEYVKLMQQDTDYNALVLGNKNLAKNQTVNGSFLDEKLVGGIKNDTLKSGAGVDILEGGQGNDKLYGIISNKVYTDVSNAKTFVFNVNEYGNGDGQDVIYDAKAADKIQINGLDSLGGITYTKSGNNLIIQYTDKTDAKDRALDTITIANYYKTGVGSSVKELEIAGVGTVDLTTKAMEGSKNAKGDELNDYYNLTGTATVNDKGGNEKYDVNATAGTIIINETTAIEKSNDTYNIKGEGTATSYANVTINDTFGNDAYNVFGNGYKDVIVTDNKGTDKYNFTGNDSYATADITDMGNSNDKYTISGNNRKGDITIDDFGGKDSYSISGNNTATNITIYDHLSTDPNAKKDANNDTYSISGKNRTGYIEIVDEGGDNKFNIKSTGKSVTEITSGSIIDGENDEEIIIAGNDTYSVSTIKNGEKVVIDDLGGDKDTLIVSNLNNKTIAMMFNWDKNGNIAEDDNANNLYISGKDCKGGITVENYLSTGKIETIKAGSKAIDVNAIATDALSQQVATWLKSNTDFADVNAVFENGTDADIASLMAQIYQ